MFVGRALRFNLLRQSKRTAIQHRPRWANENQGQYFGSLWLRRQMVENGEVVFSLGGIVLIALPYFIYRRAFHPGLQEDQKWGRIMWRGMLDPKLGGYFPRPIRESELNDPSSPFHNIREHIGDWNTMNPPTFDAGHDWNRLHFKFFDIFNYMFTGGK